MRLLRAVDRMPQKFSALTQRPMRPGHEHSVTPVLEKMHHHPTHRKGRTSASDKPRERLSHGAAEGSQAGHP